MQICHIIRNQELLTQLEVTGDLKRHKRKGWPLGKAWALEEKKSNRKKPLSANCLSPRSLLHETLMLARDKKKKKKTKM